MSDAPAIAPRATVGPLFLEALLGRLEALEELNRGLARRVALLEAAQPPKVRRIVEVSWLRIPTFEDWMGAVYMGARRKDSRPCEAPITSRRRAAGARSV